MGFPREAHKMLIGPAFTRLSHVLKLISKDQTSKPWMEEVDSAHMSTWMECVGASTVEADMAPAERQHLAASLDLSA